MQDYGFRISDNRLGRFLSVDPLTESYPWYTPYQFAGNTPIVSFDIDGKEPSYPMNLSEYSKSLEKGKSAVTYKRFFGNAINPLDAFKVQSYYKLNYSIRLMKDDAYTSYPFYEGTVGVREKNQLGWHDCITSIMAATQIIQNDFLLETRNEVGKYVSYLRTKGMVKNSINVDLTHTNSSGKEESINKGGTAIAIPTSSNIGEKMVEAVGVSVGTHMFIADFFGGYHGAIVQVNVTLLPNDKNHTVTFKVFDETDLSNGGTSSMGTKEFNKFIADYAAVELNTYSRDASGTPTATGTPDKKMNPTINVTEIVKK